MKAVILIQPSQGEENMVLGNVPTPEPGAGEAFVSVAYGGRNFADLMMR